MTITFKILYVKPENVSWWGDINPEKQSYIHSSIKSFSGIISYDRNVLDENIIEAVITFESEEAFTNYKKMWSDPPWTERRAYNEQNLIITFVTESRD